MKTMKVQTLIAVGVVLTWIAAMSAQAQSMTNLLTFTLTVQYSGDEVDNGTVRSVPLQSMKIGNKELLSLLGRDAFAAGKYPTNAFPVGAKLGIIDGSIVVLSKTNSLILDVSEVFWMEDSGFEYVEAGKFNDDTGLPSPSSTELGLVKFVYDDTGLTDGNHLEFQMTGLAKSTYTDTVPNATTGVYSESQTHAVTALAGQGHKDGGVFMISGSASGSGKANFVY